LLPLDVAQNNFTLTWREKVAITAVIVTTARSAQTKSLALVTNEVAFVQPAFVRRDRAPARC
jgi:hypothetical protein